MKKIAFQIHKTDNVATALSSLSEGMVELTGETDRGFVQAIENIEDGHKIAIRKITKGEPILKYGISIGTATKDIEEGSWVHLHCMRSNYDERSSHLDLHTGAPIDIEYE